MAIGRISGPLLKANLLREGVDLAFETDLLYLDVVNGRIGINTTAPTHDLQVVGTARTTNLVVDTEADIASFTINNNTIASSNSVINLEPSGSNPVVYQGKLVVNSNLQLTTNTISTTVTDDNLNFNTSGTGQVNVNSNMLVNGDLHATGNITADGNITIGDNSSDNVIFKADIASNIIPDQTNFYNLGSDPTVGGNAWKTAYLQSVQATNITSNSILINGIDLALPQGNTIYVATTGLDTNAGLHEHNPVLTIKHALTLAIPGDTVYIYSGTYTEVFPLIVPQGVSVKGANLRTVTIQPTTLTRYNDAFLLNGETTIEDLTVANFFSGGNFFTVTSASAGSVTFNAGVAPFAHTWVSGGTVTINGTPYAVTGATYNYLTGVTTVTHGGGTATGTIFLSGLTFNCGTGTTRVFPDNGYAFRFATNIIVTTRSPYIRDVTVVTRGSVTSSGDPYGFDQNDAGKGAYIDGAYANVTSKEASMLFHAVTFFTPNRETIVATNGVRIEWLNSFSYFADKGFYAFSSSDGFALAGLTRLRIDTRVGTWNVGNTVSYYDTDGITVLGSGTIASISGNYVNLTGRCSGFQTITDRAGKTVYPHSGAKLSTSQKKFGASSLALNGTTDYITVASTPDFAFGTGAFCLEAWIYNTAQGSSNQIIFDFRSTNPQWAPTFYINATTNTLRFVANGNVLIESTGTIPLNTWTHIALAKSGTSTKMFVDGTQTGSTYTDNNTYVQGPLTLGARFDGTTAFVGYIDDVRISKGVARYTTNFTAPTSQLTGDLNTVLLLNMNGNNNATTILDNGITFQDVRTSAGGTATLINFADYSDFGAEIRSIGSANVYGNYGVYGDGIGVIGYFVSHNVAYVGAGKLTTNDPNDRIAANEFIQLNGAKIYHTSVDNEGNFTVGSNFSINQKTGEVVFNNQSLNITSLTGVTFTDGIHSTTITSTDITTGNIRIHDNNIDSLTGDIIVTSASGAINLQNNTYVTGNLNVTGDVNIGGNIQIGDASSDTVNFVASINSNLIPATTAFYDLGTTLLRWKTAFLNRAEIDNLVIDNNVISTTNANDDLTLIANGAGRIYIPSNNVQIDQSLTVTTDLTVTTGTTYLKNTAVTGTITQTGDINQTGNFVTSGNTQVTGNITGTGYLQLPQIQISGNTVTTRVSGTDLNLIANGTGNVVVEGIMVNDNNIQSVASNSNITLVPQGTGGVVINSNQSVQIPVGTTAQRPDSGTATNGMIRYNTDLTRYEGYNNGYWVKLGGLQDVAGNTKIIAEATPGANDNTLYFYANGTLMTTIDSTKLQTQRFQTANLDVQGNTITPLTSNSDINLTTTGAGGVRLGNLKIFNNTITNIVSGAITEFAESGTGYVRIAGTNGVVIPSGDTLTQRPLIPETGMMRFNTDSILVEVYNGVTWTSVAGSSGGVTTLEANELGIAAALIFG